MVRTATIGPDRPDRPVRDEAVVDVHNHNPALPDSRGDLVPLGSASPNYRVSPDSRESDLDVAFSCRAGGSYYQVPRFGRGSRESVQLGTMYRTVTDAALRS